MRCVSLSVDPEGLLASPEEMSDEVTEAAVWYGRYRRLPGWLSLETRAWIRANPDGFRTRAATTPRPPHHGFEALTRRLAERRAGGYTLSA